MTHRALANVGLAACFCLSAPAALAQVTADELWAEWQAQAAATGQPVTAATVTETGNGLTLGGVTSQYVDSDVSVRSAVDEIRMVENGDGGVDITMSQPYRISLTFPVDGSPGEATIEVLLFHENLAITANGPVEARTYSYTADLLTMTEGAITSGGMPVSMELDGEMRGLNAEYIVDGRNPDNLAITSTTQLDSIAIGLDLRPEDPSQGYLKSSFQMADLATTGNATLGAIGALAAADGLPEGFALDSVVEYGALAFVFDLQQPGEPLRIANSTRGGSLSTTINDTMLAYGIAATGSQWELEAPDLPLPIEVSAGQSEFRFEIPVAAAPDPQGFAARLAYEDVMLDDTIWAMMDPAQVVPRDPISLVADVSGMVRVLVDMMQTDPGSLNAPPGELRSLDINELRVAAAGAELTGDGALTFAEGQAMPLPQGRVELGLSGGLALLDRLQASGAVPAEEMVGIRAALGAFARPGATPDTLESTVEFGPNGTITANGLPLQ